MRWEKGTQPTPIDWYAGKQYDEDIASAKKVLADLAVDGETGKHPEFKGNVTTVYTNPLSEGGSGNSHYGGNSRT